MKLKERHGLLIVLLSKHAKTTLLLHVPYLSTLDDTAALHFSLSIAILVACSHCILIHSLILSYQLLLGQPLPLVPSMHPSSNVPYTLLSRIKFPKYLSFLALNMLINVRFSSILWSTSSFIIFSADDNFGIFLCDTSRTLQGASQVLLLQSMSLLNKQCTP